MGEQDENGGQLDRAVEVGFSGLKLFAGQQGAREQTERVLAQLGEDGGQVLVVGLMGTGKTTALERIAASVVDVDDVAAREHVGQNADERIVWVANPNNVRGVAVGDEVQRVVVKAATAEEIGNYIDGLPATSSGLDRAELVEYSLGIPYLAQAINVCTRREDIVSLVAGFLRANLPAGVAAKMVDAGDLAGARQVLEDALSCYLSVRVPDAVIEAISDPRRWSINEKSLEGLTSRLVQEWAGNGELPPVFLAQKSRELYGRFFRKDFSPFKNTGSIAVQVLGMTEGQMAQLRRSFGLDDELLQRAETGELKVDRDSFLTGPRAGNRIEFIRKFGFGAGRKEELASAMKDESWEDPGVDNVFEGANSLAIWASRFGDSARALLAGAVVLSRHLPNLGGDYFASFFADDHGSSAHEQVVIKSLLVETLLQQLGVSYVVTYGRRGSTFFYDSSQRELVSQGPGQWGHFTPHERWILDRVGVVKEDRDRE